MNDELETYLSRCLKNWTAKYRPPINGKANLLRRASMPASSEAPPLMNYFSALLNRFSNSNDMFYSQRKWQMAGPFTQSLVWSFHFESNHRLAS
jgi:hypothetical protein